MPNRLLIVEREGKYTTSASAVLRSDQWRVETIDSVEDALAIIRIRAPQAVLIDANLGDRRTVDFVVEVGETSEGRHVPIFVVAEPGTATDAGRLPRVTMLNAPLSAYSLKTALELAVAPSAADTGEPILSVEAFDSAFAGILAEPPPSPAPEAAAKKGPSPQEMLLRDFPELADAAVGAEPKAPFRAVPQSPAPQAPVQRAAAVPPARAETPAAPAIDWQMGEALLSPREEGPKAEETVPEVLDVDLREFEGEVAAAGEAVETPAAPPHQASTETFLFSLDEIDSGEEETESLPMSRAAGASPAPLDSGVRGTEPEEEGGFEPWSVPEPGAAAAFEDRTPVPPEGVGDEEFSVEPTSLSFESTWETPGTPEVSPRSHAAAAESGGLPGGAEWMWEETPLAEEAQGSAPPSVGAAEAGKADWAENLVWEFGAEEESPAPEPTPAAAPATGAEAAEEERFEFTSWETGEIPSSEPAAPPEAAAGVRFATGEETGTKGGGAFDHGVSAASMQQSGAAETAEESLDDALVALESFRPEFPLDAEPAPQGVSAGSSHMKQSEEESVLDPLLLDSEEDLWAAGPEAPAASPAASAARPGRGAEGPPAPQEIETLIRMRVQEAVMEMLPAVTERIVAETVEKMRHPADSD